MLPWLSLRRARILWRNNPGMDEGRACDDKGTTIRVVGQAGNVLGYLGPASDTRVSDTTQRGLLLVFLDRAECDDARSA